MCVHVTMPASGHLFTTVHLPLQPGAAVPRSPHAPHNVVPKQMVSGVTQDSY